MFLTDYVAPSLIVDASAIPKDSWWCCPAERFYGQAASEQSRMRSSPEGRSLDLRSNNTERFPIKIGHEAT
jgi:hypothetical protein